MKIPSYAILLIVLGGVTVGSVFAIHDDFTLNPLKGRLQILDDGTSENAQLLVRSTTTSTDVTIEGKGKQGGQATFSVIGDGGNSVFQIIAGDPGNPQLVLWDPDDSSHNNPRYFLGLDNDTGKFSIRYQQTTGSSTGFQDRMIISPNGDICIGSGC